MMVVVIQSKSVADVQRSEGTLPVEYSDEEYVYEVLQLDRGQTEAFFDSDLAQQAQKLGITITIPSSQNEFQHGAQQSLSESADTATTRHARTLSSGSQGSASTGLTSRSSDDFVNPLVAHPTKVRKRPSSSRSLSFAEYEKYLAQHHAQNTRKLTPAPPPIPSEPAPSLFSVSTRKSYTSIKNGFRNKFKLRRNKVSREDLK